MFHHSGLTMPLLTRLLELATPHPQSRQIKSLQVFSSEENTFAAVFQTREHSHNTDI